MMQPMVDWYNVFGLAASMLLSIVTIWYANRITDLVGKARWWYALILALLMIVLRRLTSIVIELGIVAPLNGPVAFLDRVALPGLVSLFLFLGIYGLYKRLKVKL